jgi:hypothetical protein
MVGMSIGDDDFLLSVIGLGAFRFERKNSLGDCFLSIILRKSFRGTTIKSQI